jgi:S1-C subfamily serine protease
VTDTGSAQALLSRFSDELANTVEQAGRSVVSVDARGHVAASGLVWSADGVIVTADHVVERDEGIEVRLPTGEESPARLLGRDHGTDLAVLKVEASGLTPGRRPSEGAPKVGRLVLAVGRPGNGSLMATIGVVSAVTGPVRTWRHGRLEQLIQTDVTLYPGCSGSALVDADGSVLGMNTSLLVHGVSTAVPSQTIASVVTAILSGGRVKRGYLGVSTQQVPLPPALTSAAGLSAGGGLIVVSAEAGGPAEHGGLFIGDIIVAVGAARVADVDDLQAALGPESVGKSTAVRVLRGGQPTELAVVIGERP